MIVIELAGAPRGKGRARAVSTPVGARIYTDEKTRGYEAQLRFAGQQAMAGRAPLAGALSIVVEARFPVAASWSRKKRAAALAGDLHPTIKPDADNVLKMLDGLNGIVWADDRQIVHVVFDKIYSDRPGLRLFVEPIVSTVEAHAA